MILSLLITAAANFVFIGLKSVQQLNVVRSLYWVILPTSMLMAVVEVYVVAQVAQRGYSIELVAAIGIGGGLGSTAATWLHHRLHRRNDV